MQKAVTASPSKSFFRYGVDRRLRRPSDFSLVFSSRLAIRARNGSPFVLHYRFSSSGGVARLGMVIPKRYAKSAVLRNAIKRQGREIFRLHMGELPVCDLVLRLDRVLKSREGRATLEQRREWRIMIEALFVSVANLPRVLSAQ